jgi:diguanylate cyclase (GGDEF)-like protein/PAS domain S-box-containing protein
MGIFNIKPLSRVSKIIFTGLSILILYSIIASFVYAILQIEIDLYVKKSTELALYTTKLSTDLGELIIHSSSIIKYSKLNDKKRLKTSLIKAKTLMVSTDADFKNVRHYIKTAGIGIKTILPYVDKSYFNYTNLIRPIISRIIKYHSLISKKIFLTPIELALYKDSPVFSPLAVKAVKETIKREKIIRYYVNLIYLTGSLFIFASILFFIFYSKRKTKEIENLYTKFNLIFDNIYDLAYVTEFTRDAVPRHFIEVNDMALRKLGYSKNEFLKLSHLNIINATNEDILNMMKLLFEKGTMTYTTEIKTKDGNIIPFEVTSRIHITQGQPPMGICIARDITDRVKTEKELKRLSEVDPLTGAYNRNKYKEIIGKEMDRAKRHKYPLSAIMTDVDFFKAINDTYGHVTGDEVLKDIVSLIMKNIRSEDYLIRWGGEEFLIIAPYASLNNAYLLAEKLRIQAELQYFSSKGIMITLSFGIAELIENENEISFIKRADNALYKAKNSGRNRSIIFDEKSTY